MGDVVIDAHSLGKYYRIYAGKGEKWMDLLLPGNHGTNFWALRKLTFQIHAGEAVGFVGLNGSGKSTLSNLIAGISQPSSGSLKVTGNTSMIAVNAGLNMQLTGVENIEMKGLLIGMNLRQIHSLMPQIIEFSGIRQFINQPVRTYSSGMRSRLAFAISINIDPDILVLDEGLAVGDSTFVDRCLQRMEQFQKDGKTMVMTSHSGETLRRFCQRLIWMEGGEMRMDGSSGEVIRAYSQFVQWYKHLSEQEKADYTKKIYETRCQNSKGERLRQTRQPRQDKGASGGKRLRQ